MDDEDREHQDAEDRVGLSLLTALALPRPRDGRESLVFAGLAGIPALLVVAVPKFGVDLARFGPQEPLLVGGMALGGSLLVVAACALLDEARPVRPWALAPLAVGASVLWVLGVYQKETSLAALPLVASALYVGRRRLEGWKHLSRARRAALVSMGAVVALPFAHVALETARIALRGDLVYDAEVAGGHGIVDGLGELYDWAHEVLPLTARLVMLAAVVLTVLVACFRRRVDIVAVGALASGALSLVLTAQSGTVATRYYLPAFALFAVAFTLSIARLPRPAPAVGLAAIAVFEVAAVLALSLPYVPVPGGHGEVELWAERELHNGELVRTIAELETSGCVVAVAGLGREASDALPVLVSRDQGTGKRICDSGDVYLVTGAGEVGAALIGACGSGALQSVFDGSEVASIELCTRLQSEDVRDPTLGLVDPETLVGFRRFRLS